MQIMDNTLKSYVKKIEAPKMGILKNGPQNKKKYLKVSS